MARQTYSEILRENAALGKSLEGSPAYRVSVLSNIVVAQLNSLLECALRRSGINAIVASGGYDNILQDSVESRGSDLAVIFWEACNLAPSLPARANLVDTLELENAVQAQMDLVLRNLADVPLVLVNRFCALPFSRWNIHPDAYEDLCARLNVHLGNAAAAFPNVMLVDTMRTFAEAGLSQAADFRFFYSSKALYSLEFFHAYVDQVAPVIRAGAGRARKALIFDCDHTLWKGVLGEDGFEGIEMSSETKAGAIFEEVQLIAAGLSEKGVIIGICSKNNPEDVDAVFAEHKNASLKERHLSIRKVNWDDKVRNLEQIAVELNIGMDAIVFVDDSRFEIERVRESLPDVLAIQVPENLYEYPNLMRKTARSFFQKEITAEDRKRGEMYRQEAGRAATTSQFRDLEDYLASLELEVTVHIDNLEHVARLAQLSQKTNQFNLTTKRYSESEIRRFIESARHRVLSFSVRDKFGDYGLVGMGIGEIGAGKVASLDTFLMSCRTIGRNVEFPAIDFLIQSLREAGADWIDAAYVPTRKNQQVGDFYNRLGFEETAAAEGGKSYRLECALYQRRKYDYIKRTNGE